MHAGGKFIRASAGPAHRRTQAACRQSKGQVFRTERGLGAEGAAHLARDDPNARGLPAQCGSAVGLRARGRLRAEVDGQGLALLSQRALPDREHAARLHRHRQHARHLQRKLDAKERRQVGCLGPATLVMMHLGDGRLRAKLGKGLQRFELQLHPVRCLLRLRQGVGQDQRHRLAHVHHTVTGQGLHRWQLSDGQKRIGRGHVDRAPVIGQGLRGQHRHHTLSSASRLDIDRADPPVRQRRSHKRRVQGLRRLNIGSEAAPAFQKGRIFPAQRQKIDRRHGPILKRQIRTEAIANF